MCQDCSESDFDFSVNSDESSDADDMKSSASNNSEQKKIQMRKNTNKKPVREKAILRLNKDTFEFESDTDVWMYKEAIGEYQEQFCVEC